MDGSDQIQEVVATAARVKAGNATARDVAWLTAVRGGLVSSGNTALLGTIDDALAATAATPATPADVPPTDWTVQPEIGGGPMPASFSEALADAPRQPRGNGSPFDAIGALGSGAATTVNAVPDPVGAIISGSQGSALAQDNPWDTIGSNLHSFGDKLRSLQGTNIPTANQPLGHGRESVSDPGSLPPTQKPPGPDPLAAYQTAPTNESPPLGTNMPGERPGGLFGIQAETDWSDERRALKNEGLTQDERKARRAMGDTLSLPPDSAFAGVTDLQDLVYSGDMMARMIARKMGGGAMTEAMIRPEVENAMRLVQQGHIGGGGPGSGIGSELSTTDQLQAIEQFVTQMSAQAGTQVDPYAAYQEGLRRSLHTPEAQLQERATREDPNASSMDRLASQIDTTNDALLSGAGGMGKGARDKLQARLDEAAYEWLEVAMRSTPGSYITYPQFLKERGAKQWFG